MHYEDTAGRHGYGLALGLLVGHEKESVNSASHLHSLDLELTGYPFCGIAGQSLPF